MKEFALKKFSCFYDPPVITDASSYKFYVSAAGINELKNVYLRVEEPPCGEPFFIIHHRGRGDTEAKTEVIILNEGSTNEINLALDKKDEVAGSRTLVEKIAAYSVKEKADFIVYCSYHNNKIIVDMVYDLTECDWVGEYSLKSFLESMNLESKISYQMVCFGKDIADYDSLVKLCDSLDGDAFFFSSYKSGRFFKVNLNKVEVSKQYYFPQVGCNVLITGINPPIIDNPFDSYNASWVSVDGRKSGVVFAESKKELLKMFEEAKEIKND